MKKIIKKQTEPVRLESAIVDKVRENKDKTGVGISRFIEMATEKELKKKK